MATETKKNESPPYIAFSTFLSFIKGLGKTGIPSRIDKSLLRNMSGGNQSALLATLKWFGLIDDIGEHGKKLETLVEAGDDAGRILRDLLPIAYKFMADGSIQLERATGSQVEEKFRAYGLSGSTVVKAMAFFISACKEAQVPLSAHIKLPKVQRSNGLGKAKKVRHQAADDESDDDISDLKDEDGIPDTMPGFVKISIPLHGMDDGAVFLPDNMTKSQWAYALKITKFLIENYRPDDAPDGAEVNS